MERASKFKKVFQTEKDYIELKRNQKLALHSLPWRRNCVFTGERDRTQLALSSSKFLCFSLIRVEEAKTVFALIVWHRVKRSATGDTGQKSIFWVGFWSWLQQTCPWGHHRGAVPRNYWQHAPLDQEKQSRPTGCRWSDIRSVMLF